MDKIEEEMNTKMDRVEVAVKEECKTKMHAKAMEKVLGKEKEEEKDAIETLQKKRK